MANNHVGVPRLIQKGFTYDNNHVYVYDTIRNKEYIGHIDKLGTINNYYEKDVEKNILANDVENRFGVFYNKFCNATEPTLMKDLVAANVDTLLQFFSYMFLRSKKTLDIINEESLFSNLFGDFNHSELLKIQNEINVNPLKLICKEYSFYPLLNFSNISFINNSIGFSMMINKEKQISILIPLNTQVAILVTNNNKIKDKDCIYIEPNRCDKVETINESISRFEIKYGNGYIFAHTIEDIKKCKDYLIKNSLTRTN